MGYIDLYSTHCPKCIALETRLKKKGLPYNLITKFNIEEIKKKGFSSMPLLDVDGIFMEYDEAIKWVNKIK